MITGMSSAEFFAEGYQEIVDEANSIAEGSRTRHNLDEIKESLEDLRDKVQTMIDKLDGLELDPEEIAEEFPDDEQERPGT